MYNILSGNWVLGVWNSSQLVGTTEASLDKKKNDEEI